MKNSPMPPKQKKILIVEDEEPMLVILRDSVIDAGFAAVTAKNGEEGLMRAYEERPDLILLDIVMPKMDGMTVMRKLREDAWGKTVPIIFLTNLTADVGALKDAPKESAYYLVKSDYTIDEVMSHVKAVLGRQAK